MQNPNKIKTILVTGGAGFIGSNFIRYMLQTYPEYNIINLDNLSYAGNRDNLKDIEDNPGYKNRYKFEQGDICDSEIVDKLVRQCQAVINFAAESHVDRSILDPECFTKVNVLGTQKLLEAGREHNLLKFVHISTDEVYGSIEEGSFTENSQIAPNSPYAASKAAADLLAQVYYTTYKLPIVITRSSNNFGPYQYPEKVIPLFVTNALDNKSVPLYGDGMNVRDWLYVEDNSRGIDAVLHQGRLGQVYNIGGGHEIPNIELTKNILKYLGKSEDLIKPVADRPAHDRRYSLDCSKLKKELNWAPQRGFDEALQETITWYKNNRPWWEVIKNKKKEFEKYYQKQYTNR